VAQSPTMVVTEYMYWNQHTHNII